MCRTILSRIVFAAAVFVASSAGVVNAAPTHVRLAVQQELHLSPSQQMHIHKIIQSNQLNGTPPSATRRQVLGVLTPAQRQRLRTYLRPLRNPAGQ